MAELGGGYRGAAWGPNAMRASPSTVAWGENKGTLPSSLNS
jgi:hypothetical protein